MDADNVSKLESSFKKNNEESVMMSVNPFFLLFDKLAIKKYENSCKVV